MTCRNVFHRRRNRDLDVYPASKGWEVPADGPTGVRHEGGVTLRQAPIRNTGTRRPDVKGDPQGSAAKPKRSVTVRVRVPMRGTGTEQGNRLNRDEMPHWQDSCLRPGPPHWFQSGKLLTNPPFFA